MTEIAFDPGEKLQSQLPAVQLLAALGYAPLSPAEALALRGGRRRNAVLEDVLAAQIIKLNTFEFRGRRYPLDPADAQDAIRQLLAPDQIKGLQATNEAVYDRLVLGATVAKTIDGATRSHQVRFVDWADPSNNAFHVTVEYSVDRTGSTDSDRLDVVGFVNGIPFVAIECKRPSEPVKKADHQLIRYQRADHVPAFFHAAQLLISTNRREARYATVGAPSKFWSPWVEVDDAEDDVRVAVQHPLDPSIIDGLFVDERARAAARDQLGGLADRTPSDQDALLYALCRPERLLEIVRSFTVFDGGQRKIARHQQYFAVRRTIERVTSGSAGGPRPGGVVWHTQGSGKSLTMVMLAKALEFEPTIHNPRIILVTDRDDLDLQIRDTFRACQLEPVRAKSGKHLAQLLADRTPLITTIVNKFDNAATWMSASTSDMDPNVFVLVDESHRSHSARQGEYGIFAQRMRRMLPVANYIGFTGTPLLKREKSTFRTFGAPIHTYTIRDAQRDEAVVPLLYEGRMIDQQIADAVIDAWFEKICQGLTREQQADLKRKFSRADVLSGAGQVVRAKAFDISEHYRQHWQGTGLKAQLVAPNKAAAIRFKNVLDEIGHVRSEVMISPPGDDETSEAGDRESREIVQRFWDDAMQRYGGEAAYNQQVVTDFKGPNGPEILIVVSKLLTGFDAPRNTVLYICRSLREHTLLQAIARVNRLYEPDHDEDPPKDFGHIIDYEGLLGELSDALTTYSALDGFDLDDLLGAVVDVRAEIAMLPDRWAAVWALFRGVRRDDMEALERHLEPDEVRDEFYALLSEFTRTLHIALSSDKVEDDVPRERLDLYKADWRRFVELRRSAQWRYNERVDLRDYEPKIQKLLDDHLTALPAEVIIPELELNDPASVQATAQEHGQSAASRADRIASATRRRITERMDEDPVLYTRFAALIRETLEAHRAHRLSEIEYLERMQTIARDVAAERRGTALPSSLTHHATASAVFEAINRHFPGVGADRDVDHAVVADIALRLVAIVEEHHIVGLWENVPAQNDLLNAIDDYLWDDAPQLLGGALTAEQEDAIRADLLTIGRARLP